MRETNDAKSSAAERILWWGVGIVGVASIALSWFLLGRQRHPLNGALHSEAARRDAIARCELAVRQRVYEPSSAQFPPNDITTTPYDDSSFVVQGTVASRNGLGTSSHDRFRCELHLSGRGWVVRNVVTR